MHEWWGDFLVTRLLPKRCKTLSRRFLLVASLHLAGEATARAQLCCLPRGPIEPIALRNEHHHPALVKGPTGGWAHCLQRAASIAHTTALQEWYAPRHSTSSALLYDGPKHGEVLHHRQQANYMQGEQSSPRQCMRQ